MNVDELVAEAQEFLQSVEPVEQEVYVGKRKALFRFRPLEPLAWRRLTLKHPARSEFVYDLRLGYDIDAVVADYPEVTVTIGGEKIALVSEDEEGNKKSLLPKLLSAVRGDGLRTLAMIVWGLNDYIPAKELDEAGKASAGSPESTPS